MYGNGARSDNARPVASSNSPTQKLLVEGLHYEITDAELDVSRQRHSEAHSPCPHLPFSLFPDRDCLSRLDPRKNASSGCALLCSIACGDQDCVSYYIPYTILSFLFYIFHLSASTSTIDLVARLEQPPSYTRKFKTPSTPRRSMMAQTQRDSPSRFHLRFFENSSPEALLEVQVVQQLLQTKVLTCSRG
jgi:hypothetical protein